MPKYLRRSIRSSKHKEISIRADGKSLGTYRTELRTYAAAAMGREVGLFIATHETLCVVVTTRDVGRYIYIYSLPTLIVSG